MKLSTTQDWLDWIEKQHGKSIDLGLDRVKQVAASLDLLKRPCPVIIVGGTNGKGSTVAGLEAIYLAQGRKVGVFTSPAMFKHNELVRIQGIQASDEDFCEAYEKISEKVGEITLTPFEWNTLAALLIFTKHHLDVIILEVGLGGRLDAVNIIEATLAIVTNIGIDHVDYLGPTRESIGFEKAGIFRKNQLVVCGDPNPPASLVDYAKEIGANIFYNNQDYTYQQTTHNWTFISNQQTITHLPLPKLAIENMATVLMAVTLLQSQLPVTEENIKKALEKVFLIGRLQVIKGEVNKLFDVSHNPDSVLKLKQYLNQHKAKGKTIAVFSMLTDKDILSSVNIIKENIDEWFVAPLNVKRAASLEQLKEVFNQAGISSVSYFKDIKEAYLKAEKAAKKDDCLVMFGSFHVVGECLSLKDNK